MSPSQELQEAVKAVLVEEATIKRLQHEVVFKIKDLDMLTSKQDILEALNREFSKEKGVVKMTSVKTLQKTYGDAQTAVVQLPAKIAQIAIARGELEIGWVNLSDQKD
ncbi:hypothetical protein TSAR_005455 [Trichomalopsis sarcophagae]|uniref:Uncharacterized protein n=1 Tax=Trichomalopsis sarcophagae TaxID=543379 RepID=A0A232ER35_9HYME|nr:hypothetical protein TSAR_005455 [Trichomalopsis sarcophagae]